MATEPWVPIIDGHNDTLLSLHLADRAQGRNFFERGASGYIERITARGRQGRGRCWRSHCIEKGPRQDRLLAECRAGLHESLQITQNPGPAAAALLNVTQATHHLGGVRGAREVVGQGQLRDALPAGRDLIG